MVFKGSIRYQFESDYPLQKGRKQMMGHKAKMIDGDERDAFRARNLYVYLSRSKVAHSIKKRFSKRMRRQSKLTLSNEGHGG